MSENLLKRKSFFCAFIVRIPLSSLFWSNDLVMMRMKGIITETEAADTEMDLVMSSIDDISLSSFLANVL